jgi:hypothetical protein
MLQEKVREALNQSITMSQFINNLERQNIHVLFNQASTGRVSGITYLIPGFKIRGQALGNQFKFGSITKQINYEQNRDGQAIGQANKRTRAKYGTAAKTGTSKHQQGIGIPYSKQWYHHQKSKSIGGLPEIPFGFIDKNQARNLRLDQRTESHERITKEDPDHLDHHISHHQHTSRSFLGGLADLLDVQVNNVPGKKRNRERKRGIGR